MLADDTCEESKIRMNKVVRKNLKVAPPPSCRCVTTLASLPLISDSCEFARNFWRVFSSVLSLSLRCAWVTSWW